MITLKSLLQKIKFRLLEQIGEDYEFDWDNHEYYIRWSDYIEEDLKRNWSSWDFGQGGIEGNREYIESLIDKVLNGDDEYMLISNFELWEDELDRGVVLVDKESTLNYVDNTKTYIGELYDDYWVLIDTVNAAGGISGHLLDEDINSLYGVIKIMNDDGMSIMYDGTGDGQVFDGTYAKIIFSDDDGWHLLQI